MVSDRARKKKIRAHMAATGQSFLRSARELDGVDYSYLRTAWSNSAWPRLMPLEAVHLEVVIGTASVLNQDGDLAKLVANHPASHQFPDGVDTVLIWQDSDDLDPDTVALQRHAKASFNAAASALGRPVPTTVAGLADFLAAVGVYQHTQAADGTHQWRAPNEIPDPLDTLPLPADWIEHEEHVRWNKNAGPAIALRRALQAHRGRDQVDTTLQRLAAEADMSVHAARAGLDGLMFRFGLVVLRHGSRLERRDLTALVEHARIGLVIDWTSSDFAVDLDNEHDDEMQMVWEGAPWLIYRNIANDSRIPENSRDLVGYMPFAIGQPDGSTFPTCLAGMAAEQALSIDATVSSLVELETVGLLRWRVDRQLAELAAAPNQFGGA